jgi:hypothetical protein
VNLREIDRPYSYEGFRAERFRPAIEHQEDISVFMRELETASKSRASLRSHAACRRRGGAPRPISGPRQPAFSRNKTRELTPTPVRATERGLGFSLTISAARADYFWAARVGSRRRPRQEYANRN